MDKLKARVGEILNELEKASLKLNLESKKNQISDLEVEISNPEIWLNPKTAQEKVKKLADKTKNTNTFFKILLLPKILFVAILNHSLFVIPSPLLYTTFFLCQIIGLPASLSGLL